MGLALGVLPNGKHVAFTAGTGILVFIDLIAHLILRLLSQNPSLNVFKTLFRMYMFYSSKDILNEFGIKTTLFQYLSCSYFVL